MGQVEQLKEKWMENYDVVLGEDKEEETLTDFSRVFEEKKDRIFDEGEIFTGRVVSIGKEYVSVDIGYKQEGPIPKREFMNYDGTLKIQEGDKVDVYLEKLESHQGYLVLSRDKAEIIEAWDNIAQACDKEKSVEGTILSKVKGGLSVDIGVKAFLPSSQIDIKPVRQLNKYIGQRMEFKVIKFNKKRGNIVLSRKAILQEERREMREEVLGRLHEEMIVKGVVKNITDYGAFVDLGGIDGLLHITDMSWGRIKHPSSLLGLGDEIEVKILKFDHDKERVSLGLKQVRENPWENVPEIYHIGDKVSGKIVSIKEYGIFVELSDGIEGLVHVSEMSWVGDIKNPAGHFSMGEVIETQVLDVDIDNKRISLGLKQFLPNPWEELEQKYTEGMKVTGKIASVVDFGLFVDLGEAVDALVHVSDISWVRKNINAKKAYKEGQEIEAVVLSVDKDTQKFCLGIKQLTEDPWSKIEEKHPVGSIIPVKIVRVTDFGAFALMDNDIEGLIHISELSEETIEKTSDVVAVGDQVDALILSIDRESKKVGLSLKLAQEQPDEEEAQASGEEEPVKEEEPAGEEKPAESSS